MKRLLIIALTGMGLISTAALARSSDEPTRAFLGAWVDDEQGSGDEMPQGEGETPSGPSDEETPMSPSDKATPPSGGEAPSVPSGGDMPMSTPMGGNCPSGGTADGGLGGDGPAGGDMPGGGAGGAGGDMGDGKNDPKQNAKPNLAVTELKLQKNGTTTMLLGTIKNMGLENMPDATNPKAIKGI